jgi:hypothetical protein
MTLKISRRAAMDMHERFVGPDAMMPGAGASLRTLSFGSLLVRLAAWAKTCADYFAAAATYEDLSRLSDTQLRHRGLSRDILARDLGEWRDGHSSR